MKIQGIAKNGMAAPMKDNLSASPSFKGYIPRDYKHLRGLGDIVYENSSGPRKALLYMYRKSGENLNNAITALGTTFVAPFFIAFNPMSKEDTNSKKYTALRQPISACITLGSQLLVMSNYNKWLDRHAAYLGVEEMDLKAKPPVSVLKPRVKHEYRQYFADCVAKGVEAEPKKTWINNRIREIQDEAFYKTLDEMRQNLDASKLEMKDLVKVSSLQDKRKECFKEVLKNKYSYSSAELEPFASYDDFVKKGKKLAKTKGLEHSSVIESIDEEAMRRASEDLQKCMDVEAKVKLQTSLQKREMQKTFNAERLKINSKYNSEQGIESVEQLNKELNAAKKKIYQDTLNKLKVEYEKILPKQNILDIINTLIKKEQLESKEIVSLLDNLNNEKAKELKSELLKLTQSDKVTYTNKLKEFAKQYALTEDETVTKHVYEKLLRNKAEGFEALKDHGTTLKKVMDRVKVKRYLVNRINKAEAKLKGWKDRSGMLVGLAILPLTCGLLNWAYPRIMEKCFPKLSAAKAESKARQYGLIDDKNKDVKEAK